LSAFVGGHPGYLLPIVDKAGNSCHP
jgi:hypothetical protein